MSEQLGEYISEILIDGDKGLEHNGAGTCGISDTVASNLPALPAKVLYIHNLLSLIFPTTLGLNRYVFFLSFHR